MYRVLSLVFLTVVMVARPLLGSTLDDHTRVEYLRIFGRESVATDAALGLSPTTLTTCLGDVVESKVILRAPAVSPERLGIGNQGHEFWMGEIVFLPEAISESRELDRTDASQVLTVGINALLSIPAIYGPRNIMTNLSLVPRLERLDDRVVRSLFGPKALYAKAKIILAEAPVTPETVTIQTHLYMQLEAPADYLSGVNAKPVFWTTMHGHLILVPHSKHRGGPNLSTRGINQLFTTPAVFDPASWKNRIE